MSSGQEFDATKAQTFEKGKTSKADVIAAMGQPMRTGSSPDGSYIEYYRETALAGPGRLTQSVVKIKVCNFMFDARDTLKDYSCSEGEPSPSK